MASRSCPAQARGLVYAAKGKRLIDGIDLDLSAGSTTVILGPNGAGKSLLLRLLHGLIAPTDGVILWGGQPLTEAVRRRQAMVFQRPVLLRRSVMANLRFAARLRSNASCERCEELLRLVDLEARARQPARLLSGGEQQRLAMARALATNPEVIFLDEPTASLDPASTAKIEQLVMAASQLGAKIVFVTHDRGQAERLADEVLFLHRGRLLEQVPAARFFDRPESQEARDYLAGHLVF